MLVWRKYLIWYNKTKLCQTSSLKYLSKVMVLIMDFGNISTIIIVNNVVEVHIHSSKNKCISHFLFFPMKVVLLLTYCICSLKIKKKCSFPFFAQKVSFCTSFTFLREFSTVVLNVNSFFDNWTLLLIYRTFL